MLINIKGYWNNKAIFYKLYTLYNKGKLPETMRERCCNFKLLEEKCLKYTIIDRSLHG